MNTWRIEMKNKIFFLPWALLVLTGSLSGQSWQVSYALPAQPVLLSAGADVEITVTSQSAEILHGLFVSDFLPAGWTPTMSSAKINSAVISNLLTESGSVGQVYSGLFCWRMVLETPPGFQEGHLLNNGDVLKLNYHISTQTPGVFALPALHVTGYFSTSKAAYWYKPAANPDTLTFISKALAILSAALPTATVGQTYQQQLSAEGGTTPWLWKISSGVLPGGLTLNPASGIISGNPQSAGHFTFTVQLSDASVPQLQTTANLVIDVQNASALTGPEPIQPGFVLEQNYPNPFNPQTTIVYELEKPMIIQLEIVDLLGQPVALVFSGKQQAGAHRHLFRADNLAAGIYLIRLSGESRSEVRKMILLK